MACINDHRCNSCPHPCKTRNVEHMKWYASQSIKNKELVTGKPYPECTVVWNAWTQDERTDAIERSGLKRPTGNKETALGHDF